MAIPLIPDDAFPPQPTAPCYCGTGRSYATCCGDRSHNRPPFGIDIMDEFLSPDECQAMLTLIASKATDPYKVRNPDGTITPDPTRVCERIVFGDDQSILDSLVRRAWKEVIIPRTGIDLEWFEEPQLLKYIKGGFYYYHADNGYLVIKEHAWRKAVDRDLSLLIYLSNDFKGGDLHFNRLEYSLWPKAGMLVWFPSDMRFQHAAKPVESGTRYAIVSWAAAENVERVQDARTTRAIDWETRQKNS
jgi:hypothetical protein